MLIPVGGVYTIGPKDAVDLAKEFEAPYILPMHYKASGMKEDTFGKMSSVEDFLKESGYEVENIDKLTIKKELINYEQRKVVVLEKR